MNRYKKCSVRVNKELVKRLIVWKYGSIKNYFTQLGISKMRFWQIMNQPHLSKDVKCLQQLANDLELSIDEILM